MAFTGKLGTAASRPGNLVPGSGAITVPSTSTTSTLSADAVIRAIQASTFSANAVIRAAQAGTLSANAVVRAPIAGSASFDAVISALGPHFSLDAVLSRVVSASLGVYASIGASPGTQHDRDVSHYATQDDLVIVTDSQLDRYPLGSTLHFVVADLISRALSLTGTDPATGLNFGIDSFVQPSFALEAIVLRTVANSLSLDAWIARGSSLALDANIFAIYRHDVPFSAWIAE